METTKLKLPYALLTILLVFNAFFIAYGLQRHATFQTGGFDLGNYDQMVWGTLHGRPFWFTQHRNMTSGLGNHFEAIIVLFAPLYGLYRSPLTLLIGQTLLVSLGVLPIYWFAKKELHSHTGGLIFVCVYLLYPGLGAALAYDFHSIAIATPFLTYALWAMYTQRPRLFAVMAILTMLCKEDTPLLIFMLGLYILFVQRRIRYGSLTIIGSLLWFVLIMKVIIPAFSPAGESRYFYRYAMWGNNLSELAWSIVAHPWQVAQFATSGDKFFFWARLAMPMAYLAWLDPLTLLLAAPTLLASTLSNYPPLYQLDLYYYAAPLTPYVTFASIRGLARLLHFAQPKFRHVKPAFLRNTLLTMLLLVTLAYQTQFGHTPLGQRYFNWPQRTERHNYMEAMLASIPPNAVVVAENNLASRLSERDWIAVPPLLSPNWPTIEYLALDLRGNLDLYESRAQYCQQLHTYLNDPAYGLIYAHDGLLLFKRGAPPDTAVFEPLEPCLIIPH